MTDNAFLLSVLNDGRWHSNAEIFQASIAERGCGLTIHSRAADLRKLGYTVETKIGQNGNRRVAFYRMVVLDSPAADGAPPSALAVAGESSPSIPDPSPGDAAGRGGALALFDYPRGAYQEDQ